MFKSTVLQDRTVTREQIREQIKQQVQDVQQAVREATADVRAEQAAGGAGGAGGAGVLVTPPQPPGIPGTQVPVFTPDMIPPQVEGIAISFFMMIAAIIIGYPLMRAFARRIERGAPAPQPIPAEVRDQLQQISQSVDAIAIEVERISEGQRFTTKMLVDRSKEIAPASSAGGGQS